jgi:hypothetical protein
VLALFLGETTPEDLRKAALAGDEAGRTARICDAAYYAGLHAVLRGQAEAARPLIDEAVTVCPLNTMERALAIGEQRRLQR